MSNINYMLFALVYIDFVISEGARYRLLQPQLIFVCK